MVTSQAYWLAGSDDEWTKVGPEDEHNWLNVSGLETGSDYEFRVVAMNNGDNQTVSEPKVIYVGERQGLFHSSSAMLLLQSFLLQLILFENKLQPLP